MKLDPGTPLHEVEWIGPSKAKVLSRMNLVHAVDLVEHLPRRHEDRSWFPEFPEMERDDPVCLRGKVVRTRRTFYGGRRGGFEVELEESGETALQRRLTCRWFNMSFLDRVILQGHDLIVYGKPKIRKHKPVMDHPEFEVVVEGEENSLHMDRLVPVYPSTEGLGQRQMRIWIHRMLQEIEGSGLIQICPGSLPFSSRFEALQAVHFPEDETALKNAREHLILTEFFRLQLRVSWKRQLRRQVRHPARAGSLEQMKSFVKQLEFPLTGAQRRCLREIVEDLRTEVPMNRLLQGDVGSGKTVVAAGAALAVIEAGGRAVLMAPTQILAEQHYRTFSDWFRPLGIPVGLRTATRRELSMLPLEAGGEEPALLVGTHALFHGENLPPNTRLVVIDEQHKFGVLQRERLVARAGHPDVLVMTATPIPRTLTMTLYGDLEVSLLDELPARKARIVTGVREETKLPQAAAFIREQLEEGRQAYIVYPLIEGEEEAGSVTAGARKAASQEFKRWSELLAPHSCGLLHGGLDPAEKERVMREFSEGTIQVLVATTVVEVGINVPNANLILIEAAEQFGLAQLHQLRGRVGRGEHKSYCILLTGKTDEPTLEKLRILERTADGFEIAEEDWKLRGPGDLVGTAQSGLPQLQVGDLLRDEGLMREARERAGQLLRADPSLKATKNQHFRRMVVESEEMTHLS